MRSFLSISAEKSKEKHPPDRKETQRRNKILLLLLSPSQQWHRGRESFPRKKRSESSGAGWWCLKGHWFLTTLDPFSIKLNHFDQFGQFNPENVVSRVPGIQTASHWFRTSRQGSVFSCGSGTMGSKQHVHMLERNNAARKISNRRTLMEDIRCNDEVRHCRWAQHIRLQHRGFSCSTAFAKSKNDLSENIFFLAREPPQACRLELNLKSLPHCFVRQTLSCFAAVLRSLGPVCSLWGRWFCFDICPLRRSDTINNPSKVLQVMDLHAFWEVSDVWPKWWVSRKNLMFIRNLDLQTVDQRQRQSTSCEQHSAAGPLWMPEQLQIILYLFPIQKPKTQLQWGNPEHF